MADKIWCSNNIWGGYLNLGAGVLCLWIFVFVQPGIILAQSSSRGESLEPMKA